MDVLPQQHNVPLQDIAQALTNSLPRDGSAAMTGDLPMGGRKITGLGNGTAPQDAAAFGQIPVLSEFVKSMSSLSMAADRVIYSLNTTTAAMAVCTAYGRSLWGAADAVAARGALGLTAGATATAKTQAVWNAGTDTSESIISPQKLRGTVANMSAGWSQEWQDVSGFRTAGTVYQNTTPRPIMVAVTFRGRGSSFQVSTNGSTGWIIIGYGFENVHDRATVSAIIPVGHYYRIANNVEGVTHWSELR